MIENMNDSSKKLNEGYFNITYNEEGVFLTVYPPVGRGAKVEVHEVLERLNKKKINKINRQLIEFIVLRAEKKAVKIDEPQEEVKLDADIKVSLSTDKMKASITITKPDGGRMLTVEEIIEKLNNEGVVYGIDESILSNVVEYPVYNQMICVAEGVSSINGKNGKVEYFFETKKIHKPTFFDDGRVDYRELNLIESVRKGKVLCSIIPPVSGTNGKNVCGNEIRALDGKPVVLPRGKNVETSEDGQMLIATIDGQVNYIDGKVNVFSNYEVPADVDTSTGNIYFVGNVIVRGNVLSGFCIEAGGNVEVWGVVEGAVIKSGGDIILRRGMQGVGKGILISNNDIIARYIEHSNIEAKNDITAEAIMHSNIKCGNKLELMGKKGLLVGGNCKVSKEISTKVIGSPMSTVTDIEVGLDPHLRERYKTLREEINSFESDLKKAEQAIVILKKLESSGMLTPEKQEIMGKSVRTKIFLSNKIVELKNEMKDIEEKLHTEGNGKIRVSNIIYPGTKVAIGTSSMYVKENLQYCILYRDGADIRVGSYDK